MRHERTLLVRVIYAFFVGICASWMILVICKTDHWNFWHATGLAFLGAAMIAALGLRIVTKLDTRWFIQSCNRKARRQPIIGNDPLVSCQVGFRQPYFDARVN